MPPPHAKAPLHTLHTFLIAGLTLGAAQMTQAQATLKPDGQTRAAIGLGASFATGNSESSNLSLNADLVRATEDSKISLYGKAQYARSSDATSDEQARIGGRYDQDLNARVFSYAGADLEHNKQANLKLRNQINAGLGYHLIKREDHRFDVFGGLSYAEDRYINPTVIDDRLRGSFRYASLMLGEESSHQLTNTTRFKQRLSLLPNLESRGEYRANWDADLAVAINKTMNLTVGLAVAHNSEPGLGRKSTDSLLTTGISVKFD
jgi:putative salt-induced outer membrane protein